MRRRIPDQRAAGFEGRVRPLAADRAPVSPPSIPATRYAFLGAIAMSTPMRPSTWSKRSSSAASAASAGCRRWRRSLTVPADAITQHRRNPSALSVTIAARSAWMSRRRAGSVGIRRRARYQGQRLRRLAIARMDLIGAVEAERLRLRRPQVHAHRRQLSCFAGDVRPMMFTIEPSLTSVRWRKLETRPSSCTSPRPAGPSARRRDCRRLGSSLGALQESRRS